MSLSRAARSFPRPWPLVDLKELVLSAFVHLLPIVAITLVLPWLAGRRWVSA